VLGAEDRRQVDPVVGVHHVDDVPGVAGDAGRVGDHADLLAVQQRVTVRGEALETGPQRTPARRRGGGDRRARRLGCPRDTGRGDGQGAGGGGEQASSGQSHGA
jgi:hypothetical protein